MAWWCLCSQSLAGDKQPPKKQKKKKKKQTAGKRTREKQHETATEPATKLQKSSDSPGHHSAAEESNAEPPPAEAHHAPAASQHATPDMSAWDDYGLDDLVVASLARLGFTSPTDIQHESLPAAILGNSDVIAAAQTVCYLKC